MILVNKGNFSVGTFVKRHDSDTTPKNTFYANFKVCLALEGAAIWNIDGYDYRIRKGDIVFLKMGQKRYFTSFGPEGFAFCAFTMGREAFSGQRHFMYFLERISKQGNLLQNPVLSALLAEIYAETGRGAEMSYELISALLTAFFIKAERGEDYTLSSVSEEHRRMLEIVDYIDRNISSDVTLRSVSQWAGLTESTLSRRFAEINGISFKQYVVEKRLQRAILLLKTTNRKMIDVAMDCGFDSISGFYSAFRKKTGTTPNKFFELDV